MKTKRILKFYYSKEDDILSGFVPSKRIKEAIEINNLITISFDKNMGFRGFEIFNASQFFSALNSKVDAAFLSSLKSVEAYLADLSGNLFIAIVLVSKDNISIQQPLPLVNTKNFESPLIASVS